MSEDNVRTDHSEQIKNLRQTGEVIARSEGGDTGALHERVLMFEAAAALLEVHDTTGISLDNWKGPREFVEMMLGEPIQENHV